MGVNSFKTRLGVQLIHEILHGAQQPGLGSESSRPKAQRHLFKNFMYTIRAQG